MWFLTINRSTKRDNIGVTDIGRRSLTPPTGVHLGTGVITAVRHADGTTPRPIDMFTSIVTPFSPESDPIFPPADRSVTLIRINLM